MKHKLLIISLLSLVLGSVPLHADVLYWSADAVNLGGAGTWNTTAIHWGTSSSGPFDRSWTNANVDSVILEGAAGTITVGASVTVNRITNNVAGFTFGGTSKITFSGTDAGVDNSTTTKVSLGPIGGSTFTKTGSGRVELSNNSDTVGRYIILGGVLTTANTNKWGSGTGVTNFLVLDNGAGWGIDTTSQNLSRDRGIYLNSGGGSLGSFNAGLTLTVNSRITGPGSLTFPAPIYSSDATWVLSNTTNDYQGDTFVKGGTLTLGASEVLPDDTYLRLTTGGSVALNGFNETVGKVYVNSSTATITGSTNTLTSTNFDLRASGTISAKLGGAAPASKTTTGTVTLTGANTFNGGMTLSAGVLRVGNNSALGTGKLTLVAGTLQTSSGTSRTLSVPVDVNGDVTLGSSTNLGNLTFQTGAWMLTNADRTLTVDTVTATISSAIGEDVPARALTKSGSGRLTLTGANTYSGGTTVYEGILQGSTTGLQGNIANYAAVVFSQTTTGAYGGTLSGSGTVTKSGSGTVMLTADNIYSGETTNSAGTLLVNNPGPGSGTGSGRVTVNSGATLGGVGIVAGVVFVDNGGSLSAGASAGMLTLQGGLTMSAGGTNVWELTAPKDDSDGVAGTDFDQLSLTTGGELDLSGSSSLLLKFTGTATTPFSTDPFWQANHSWKIVSLTAPAANTVNLPFASIANGSYNAGFFSNYVDTAGNIMLTFTPNAPSAPIITAQPQSRTNHQGTTATFTVGAFGTDPLAYQWYFPNISTPIAGATNATLTKTNVQPADAGNYLVVITNTLGSRISLPALLTVAVPQPTTLQPLVGAGTTNVVLTWDTEAGWSYQLEYNTNLATTNWYVVSNVVGAGAPVTVTNFPPAGDRQRFYRVLTQ